MRQSIVAALVATSCGSSLRLPSTPPPRISDAARESREQTVPARDMTCRDGYVPVPAGVVNYRSSLLFRKGRVRVDTFCLAPFETTVLEYSNCRAAGACPMTVPQGNCRTRVEPNAPLGCVTYGEAESYCSWRQGRLPTFDELARATEFDLGVYPPVLTPEAACLFRKVPCLVGLYGSSHGLYDLLGNLEEWTSSQLEDDFHLTHGASFLSSSSAPMDAMRFDDARAADVGVRCADSLKL